MSQFSDYYENKIIEHMMRGQSFTPPTVISAALFGTGGGLEANDATVQEITGNAYVRQTITLGTASAGISRNSASITFPEATPAAWGTITHVAIADNGSLTNWGTGVNILMWGTLAAFKGIDANDTFQFNAGSLGITVA